MCGVMGESLKKSSSICATHVYTCCVSAILLNIYYELSIIKVRNTVISV